MLPRLASPVLMLVTDRHLAGGVASLVAAVDEAVEGGVSAVQLREKDLPPEELLPLARRLRDVTRDRVALIVNGPLEVALAAEADGVHLPEAAAPIERPSRPLLIGRSVHSQTGAEQGWTECSDYLIAGPVFETASHPGAAPGGVELIQAVAGAVAIPVLAIGGVTKERVLEVLDAGASGVAVISAVFAANSPRQAAQRLRNALDEPWAAMKKDARH